MDMENVEAIAADESLPVESNVAPEVALEPEAAPARIENGLLFAFKPPKQKKAAPEKRRAIKPRPMRASEPKARAARSESEPMARFVIDPAKPAEMETIRYNLIRARVMSGLTAVEAARSIGYGNSTQLSLIESGARKIPDNIRFLVNAARAYGVSCDFLLGLSSNMEPDGQIAHQYAIARHMADISGAVGSVLANAMQNYMSEAYPTATEYRRIMEAIEKVDDGLAKMRDKYEFDEVPGGTVLSRPIEQLSAITDMLRPRLKKLKAIEDYMTDMRRGLIPEVKGLSDAYSLIARQTQGSLLAGDADAD